MFKIRSSHNQKEEKNRVKSFVKKSNYDIVESGTFSQWTFSHYLQGGHLANIQFFYYVM